MHLEHTNLSVGSIDAMLKFLTTAFPECRLRGRGEQNDIPWAHVGTDDSYVALTEVGRPAPEVGDLNHLGYVVYDVDAVAQRLTAAGFREGFQSPPHPYRKRRYFYDSDDREWEFVEYLSDDPAQRNDYTL
jgi:catechol 2,3-dioxygenase-like lactoylglutathione lyase family enzyme